MKLYMIVNHKDFIKIILPQNKSWQGAKGNFAQFEPASAMST